MKSTPAEKGFVIGCLGMVLLFLAVTLAAYGGIVYVVWHFVSKHW